MSIENVNQSTSIKRSKKEIIYPILQECTELTTDEFWRQFYDDLSCGKSSKGVYISNGIIQTSNKRNGFTYSITDKAPEVIVKELHHLLTSFTSICSKKDMSKKKQIIKEIEDELDEYDKSKWTTIKRKNVRNMLMVNYAITLHKKYNLSWKATINAYKTIYNSFENKTHCSKDVTYENGKIRHINDIEISEDGKNIINIRSDDIIESNNIEPENNTILLQSLFDSYIVALKRSIKV